MNVQVTRGDVRLSFDNVFSPRRSVVDYGTSPNGSLRRCGYPSAKWRASGNGVRPRQRVFIMCLSIIIGTEIGVGYCPWAVAGKTLLLLT